MTKTLYRTLPGPLPRPDTVSMAHIRAQITTSRDRRCCIALRAPHEAIVPLLDPAVVGCPSSPVAPYGHMHMPNREYGPTGAWVLNIGKGKITCIFGPIQVLIFLINSHLFDFIAELDGLFSVPCPDCTGVLAHTCCFALLSQAPELHG